MNTKLIHLFKKVSSIGYTLGVVSLIVGVLLSVVTQPAQASPASTGNTIWICHVPPGNPGNVNALNVDANGWNGHDNHSGDFVISGPNDPRCGGVELSLNSIQPTATEEQPTATDVPATETQTVEATEETSTPEPTSTDEPTATDQPTATLVPSDTPTATATDTDKNGLKLNLSHIYCVGDEVEIHFVLLNVPDGVTPGTLTYTYGTITPGANTGNVWHYTAHFPSGTYNVTSASVNVGGTTVNLHNPGDYAGTYNCSNVTGTPTNTATSTATNTPTSTFTATATETATPTFTATATATLELFERLGLGYACIQGQQQWTITNPNGQPIVVNWELSSASGSKSSGVKLASLAKSALGALDSGTVNVPANSQLSFFTAGGYHTMVISWTDNDGSKRTLSSTTSPTSPCFNVETTTTATPEDQITKTPDPKVTPTVGQTRSVTSTRLPTSVVTLTPRPVTSAGDPTQAVLIPVTGGDFSGGSPFSNFFVTLGFIFLGIAATSHGAALKFTKKA